MTTQKSSWWSTPIPREYQSKPVTVLALPYDGTPESCDAIRAWLARSPAQAAQLRLEARSAAPGEPAPGLTIEQPHQDALRFTPGDVLVRQNGTWHKVPGPEFAAQFDQQPRAMPVYE